MPVRIYANASAAICPSGLSADEIVSNIRQGKVAVAEHTFYDWKPEQGKAWIAAFTADQRKSISGGSDLRLPFFDQLLAAVGSAVLNNCKDFINKQRTRLIVSATKGNIAMLDRQRDAVVIPDLFLHHSADRLAKHLKIETDPVVVSHACISGLLAILTGRRLLETNQCDHVIVVAADVISRFVISGFQSLQALASGPCKPFDKERSGINLGEGAAAVILSRDPADIFNGFELLQGAVTNDANHISGPSRTGEELAAAITSAMHRSEIDFSEIDFISAHGTATLYNDEMEAKAFTAAGLNKIPLFSLKGYFGHTLGAAGLLETVVAATAMNQNTVLSNAGFSEQGTTMKLNISASSFNKASNVFLKTASGFGGGNAAMLFRRNAA